MTMAATAEKQETRNVPVQSRSKNTLEQLRTAARELYNNPEIGRDRFTTAMMSEIVGCSIGTVYRYYKDRWAVLEDIAPDRDQSPIEISAPTKKAAPVA